MEVRTVSDAETVTPDEGAASSPPRTYEGNEVTHVTLRIVDLDDGYRVTEPGVQESVTRENVHEAVAEYARLVGGEE